MNIEDTLKTDSYNSLNQNNLPTGSTRLNENSKCIKLSDTQFAYDIWYFELVNNRYILKGMYRSGILSKLQSFGYFKRVHEDNSYIFIREIENIISEVEPFLMKHQILDYIYSARDLNFHFDHQDIHVNTEKLRETFLRQSHIIFNSNFLEHLAPHTKPILRDTKESSFFNFTNCVIEVNKEEITIIPYCDLNSVCVWSQHIIKHSFNFTKFFHESHFYRFLKNVANHEPDRYDSIISAIGYLLNNYSHPSRSQAIIIYDENLTDSQCPQGGTGKGVFVQALKQVRDIAKVDGKKLDLDDRFLWQDVTLQTEIVWIDDPKPSLEFSAFHSCLTDGWSIEKKHKQQMFIKPKESPKMIITSNSIVKGEGTTNKRRQHPIEFSDHYQKQIKLGNEEPIKDEHGCTFFDNDDWTETEWNRFFSLMMTAAQFYLIKGLVPYELKNVEKNKLIQSTTEDFSVWVENQFFETGKEFKTSVYFNDFKVTYYGAESELKQRTFTNWLSLYARTRKWKIKIKRSNSESIFTFDRL